MPDFTPIISALDETWSLKETVDTVMAENRADVAEVIIAIAPQTTDACRAVVDQLEADYPGVVRRHQQQRLAGLGGAFIECAAQTEAAWIVIMSSDLETPPEKVKDLIARAKAGDVEVVATSRWMAGGDFGDYHRIKFICNWIFQKLYGLLYMTSLSDMSYGFRAYRRELFFRFRWREHGHAFFMESICKFLRAGVRIAEIPTHWRARREGESHITAAEFLRYFRAGLVVRFSRRSRFIIADPAAPESEKL